MGLFDTIKIDDDPRFVCSEGHLLYGEEFQTKDLGCTMGHAFIDVVGHDVSRMRFYDGGYGDPVQQPLLGRFDIYCNCRQCPAFVQAKTANVCPVTVDFEVEVVDDVVRAVKRISATTAHFLENEPKQKYMAGCEGPMTYEAAVARSVEIRRVR